MVASPRQFARLNRHLTQGRIHVPITARYSLGKAAQAHRRLARQHVLGRMVLQIRREGLRLLFVVAVLALVSGWAS